MERSGKDYSRVDWNKMEEEMKVLEASRKKMREKLDQVDLIINTAERERDQALKKVAEMEERLNKEVNERKQREKAIQAEITNLKKNNAALLKTSNAAEHVKHLYFLMCFFFINSWQTMMNPGAATHAKHLILHARSMLNILKTSMSCDTPA